MNKKNSVPKNAHKLSRENQKTIAITPGEDAANGTTQENAISGPVTDASAHNGYSIILAKISGNPLRFA